MQPECVISQRQRFNTEVQHVHRMRRRWTRTTQTLECMRRHHANHDQSNASFEVPVICGIELDLPALSRAVEEQGGTSKLGNDHKEWHKVLQVLRLPKDRSKRVFDAYITHVLSYDSLSDAEKQRVEQQVLANKRSGHLDMTCVRSGKWRSLEEFFKSSQHVHARFMTSADVTPEEVESRYFSLVDGGDTQVSVLSAFVDTSKCGGGFPSNASC